MNSKVILISLNIGIVFKCKIRKTFYFTYINTYFTRHIDVFLKIRRCSEIFY